MTPNTDVPNNDAPYAADENAASPKYLILDSYLTRKIDLKSMLIFF